MKKAVDEQVINRLYIYNNSKPDKGNHNPLVGGSNPPVATRVSLFFLNI